MVSWTDVLIRIKMFNRKIIYLLAPVWVHLFYLLNTNTITITIFIQCLYQRQRKRKRPTNVKADLIFPLLPVEVQTYA